MKKIQNEYFSNFCDVIKRSLTDTSKFENCLSDMISASEDDCNHKNVYDFPEHNMEVIKLDEYTKDFNIKRRSEMPEINEHQPSAVDAICINKSNEWFLIEFKNEELARAKKEARKKMLESLWLIAFLYSKLSEKFADETDFLKFARENITFIVVVSSDKNLGEINAIGTTWEENGQFYTPESYYKYKGYYFKDLYVLTEAGLRFFIELFE
jgi:hypothetical protein